MILLKTNSVLCNHVKNDFVFFSRVLYNFNSINKATKSRYSEIVYNNSSLRRGTGGRSSFSGIVATVFGASGFLGKYVINELGKIGSQVIIPYRSTYYHVKELRVMGDLGQILYLHVPELTDDNIRKSIKYSNVVINLIGKDTETRNYPHERVHVDIAGRIARISREMGVQKLIHFSALGASLNVPSYLKKDGSTFFRTKAQGEIEVMREFPDAIIFRPSDMFGHNDRFFMYFSLSVRRHGLLTQTFYPLYQLGEHTVKQPVFGSDVAKAVVFAAKDPELAGVTIEAVGPHRYRLDHLIYWIHFTLRFAEDQFRLININPLFIWKVKMHEKIKSRYPAVSMERLERECQSDLSTGLMGIEDLGVTTLTNIEERIFYELRFLRKMTHYWDALNEIPSVPPPPKSVY